MDEQLREIKNTIVELITDIISRIDTICDNTLDSDKFTRITDLLDDILALSEGIDVIKGFYSNIDLVELLEKLEIIKESMRMSDDHLLTDVLKYELKDLLGYWKESLPNNH